MEPEIVLQYGLRSESRTETEEEDDDLVCYIIGQQNLH